MYIKQIKHMKLKKISLISLILLLLHLSIFCEGHEYPAQKIDNKGSRIYFGQSQKEVEKMLGKSAEDQRLPAPVLRRGLDKRIALKTVEIKFDTQRISEIVFDGNFNFTNGIELYKQDWRRFQSIEGVALKSGMSKKEFALYLALWEKQAETLGAQKVSSIQKSTAVKSYEILVENEGDTINILFTPVRKTARGGGLWCDMISIDFVPIGDEDLYDRKAGTLNSVSMSCDEYNTRGR